MMMVVFALMMALMGSLSAAFLWWGTRRQKRQELLNRISGEGQKDTFEPKKTPEITPKVQNIQKLLHSRKMFIGCMVMSCLSVMIAAVNFENSVLLTLLVLPNIGGWGAYLSAKWRWQRECEGIAHQIPDALEMMSRMAKVGVTPEQIFARISEDLPSPLREIFDQVNQYMQIGVPPEMAMERVFERYSLPDLQTLHAIMTLQRKVGGNYSVVIDLLARTVRGRHTQEQQVKVITSEARSAAKVVMLLSVASIGGMFALNRDQFDFLIKSETGNGLLLYSVVSSFLGFLVIRRLLKVVG